MSVSDQERWARGDVERLEEGSGEPIYQEDRRNEESFEGSVIRGKMGKEKR